MDSSLRASRRQLPALISAAALCGLVGIASGCGSAPERSASARRASDTVVASAGTTPKERAKQRRERAAAVRAEARQLARSRRIAVAKQQAHEASASAEQLIQRYYRNLNVGRFGAAWEMLSPSARARLGAYEDWRAGYELTEGTRPIRLRTLIESSREIDISVELATSDLDACGDTVHQRFAVLWAFSSVGGRAVPVSLRGTKLSGRDPVRDELDCPTPPVLTEPPDDYSLPEGYTVDDVDPDVPTYVPPPDFCDVHDCIPNFENGTGYPVQCSDGSWSDSGGRSGACSWHGGVG